MRNIIIQQT